VFQFLGPGSTPLSCPTVSCVICNRTAHNRGFTFSVSHLNERQSRYCVGFSLGLIIIFTQSVLKQTECHNDYLSCFTKEKGRLPLMKRKGILWSNSLSMRALQNNRAQSTLLYLLNQIWCKQSMNEKVNSAFGFHLV